MKTTLNIISLFICFITQGQVVESWNLDIDSYTHNSSNYVTRTPPVEIAIFSNMDKVVLSQNGTLLKTNKNGKEIWRKEIETCARQRIIINKNDDILVSCGSNLSKHDENGEIIWQKDYATIFRKKHLTFDALVSDTQNNIYLVGHFFRSKHMFQVALDQNGTVKWKNKFKQRMPYDHSFIPPKQLVLLENKLFILAHDYSTSNSFLYSSNIDGKRRKEVPIKHKIKKIHPKGNTILSMGHLNTTKDTLIFTQLDKELEILKTSKYTLPRNLKYKKNTRGWATTPPTKEAYEKEYFNSYEINDFEYIDSSNILIVGSSNGNPWISNLDLKKGLTWNWDESDSRYYNFQNDTSYHRNSLFSIHQEGGKLLISGISQERDDIESMFVNYINLFVRALKFEN